MKHTINYRFNLPEKGDAVEINDINQNFGKIDNLINNDSTMIKENLKKIEELQAEKADKTYVDAQISMAGEVDSVNGKKGDVVLSGRDIKITENSPVDVFSSLNSKADKTQTIRDISSLKSQNAQHESDIKNIQVEKANRSYVDSAISNIKKVESINGKSGKVTLTGTDIKLSSTSSNSIYYELSKKADKSYVDKQMQGGGKVSSVNGKTGEVLLTGSDIQVSTNSSPSLTLDRYFASFESNIDRNESEIYSNRARIAALELLVDGGSVGGGGGGGGSVVSVNGQVGVVTLTGSDIKLSNSSSLTLASALDSKADTSDISSLQSKVSNNTSRIARLEAGGGGSSQPPTIAGADVKIVQNKYLYTSSWSLISGKYRARVNDSFITSSSIVDMNVHLDYLDSASDLYPVTDSRSGYFYVYAKEKPTQTIKFDYKVVKEG